MSNQTEKNDYLLSRIFDALNLCVCQLNRIENRLSNLSDTIDDIYADIPTQEVQLTRTDLISKICDDIANWNKNI